MQVNGRHKGETIIVLGNGPSLRDFDFQKIASRTTIGVNRINRIFNPDYVLFLDKEAWGHYGGGIQAGRPKEIFCPNAIRNHVPHFVTLFGKFEPIVVGDILSHDFDAGLFWGYTSILPAINLAYVFGAHKVVMLGVDMHDGRHFDNDEDMPGYWGSLDRIMHDFVRIKTMTNNPDHNFRIYNGNPQSAIRVFDFVEAGREF